MVVANHRLEISIPNLAVGGQAFPCDNAGCQRQEGLTDSRSGEKENV